MDVREKGHRFERQIAKLFRDIGYKRAATSRSTSKLLDSSKVDIDNIPYYIQCKHGYERGINYSALIKEIKTAIIKNYDEVIYPIMIFHKKKKTYEQNLVVIPFDDFIIMLREYEELKRNANTQKRSVS